MESAEPLVPLPPDEGHHLTAQVRVVVLEDGDEVGVLSIAYYRGQPYEVQIVTPDGVDRELKFEAGKGL